MAGRAGRRGLDKIGTVVVMCRDEIPEENDLKHVIVGSATRLESQFRLTYIMIMHLLRVEELKVLYLGKIVDCQMLHNVMHLNLFLACINILIFFTSARPRY